MKIGKAKAYHIQRQSTSKSCIGLVLFGYNSSANDEDLTRKALAVSLNTSNTSPNKLRDEKMASRDEVRRWEAEMTQFEDDSINYEGRM